MMKFIAFLCGALIPVNVHADSCIDSEKVQRFIEKNSIGVVSAYFSGIKYAPSMFVFKLKGGRVYAVDFEGDCIVRSEVMTDRQYLESTMDVGECDGCEE